jgi:hypothetical protein
MSTVRGQKFKAVLRQVNEVLLKEWAPLGFADEMPRDEYESYAMQVISRLAAGDSESEIAAYLASVERAICGKAMGVDALLPLAKRLIQFREAASAVAP